MDYGCVSDFFETVCILEDISSYYNHDYVYKTSHVRKSNKDIKLIHILLDFS